MVTAGQHVRMVVQRQVDRAVTALHRDRNTNTYIRTCAVFVLMLIGIFSGLHIHIVEHHAAQVPACAQHGVLGVIELIRGRHAGSRYEHHTVDIGGDDLRIRHRVDRRRVDDHIIVGLGALRREAPHALGREQLGRVWRDRTGADDPQRQIRHLGKLEPADLRQKVTQAGRASHAPETALPRFAHIRIDKQNALAEHGVADGNGLPP